MPPLLWPERSTNEPASITTLLDTSHTTGARLGWFLKVTVALERMETLEYLKTTAHLAGS